MSKFTKYLLISFGFALIGGGFGILLNFEDNILACIGFMIPMFYCIMEELKK